MTYASGGLIQAADYNGFVSGNTSNVNIMWSTGGSSSGYGQPLVPAVSTGGTVTATQWATLVNTITSIANHTNTTITSRTAPVTGNTIATLNALQTDINSCYARRGNAVSSGTQFTGWTGTNSKTTATSGSPWLITFSTNIAFASADAARYFFNAGGLVKIEVSKTSTGAFGDPEWNDLANTLCGDIYISGVAQYINGVSYTGTTKIGGTGVANVLASTNGWFAGTSQVIYRQFADTAPYTNNYIEHFASMGTSGLGITTKWYAADGDPISGGTAASGATPGTAPCTIVTLIPPSTTYLTNTWGTPTVTSSVV